MYHCHLYFYIIGYPNTLFEAIKSMPPLAHFTHEFFESDTPIKDLVLKADVILANLKDIPNKELLQYLAQTKHAGTKLILLSEKDQFPLFNGYST